MHSTILKILRQYHALTGGKMAERLGLSAAMITEMEHRRKLVSLETLEKAGAAFDMRLSSLVVLAEVLQSEYKLPRPGMCDKACRILAWSQEVGA